MNWKSENLTYVMLLKMNKMSNVDDFVAYIKKNLELDKRSKVLVLDELSSNLLLFIEDKGEKYIVKRYNSEYHFRIETFVLQRILGLEVLTPRVIYYESQKSSGWNWIIYDYIEGQSLYSFKNELDIDSLSNVFYEVGRFLGLYHQLSIIDGKYMYDDCKQKLINRIELDYFLTTQNIKNDSFEWVIIFLRNTYVLLENETDYTLVIKDFTDKHLLIGVFEKGYHLSGVIDFENVQFSHKFSDFVFLYVDYFFRNRILEKAFLDGYGLVLKKDIQNLIAFFILQYALELCGSLKNVHEDHEKQGEKLIKDVKCWLCNSSNFYY